MIIDRYASKLINSVHHFFHNIQIRKRTAFLTEVKVNENDEDDDEDAVEGAAAAFALATVVVLGFVTVGTLTMLNVLVMLSKLAVIAVVCRFWMRYCHLKSGIEFRRKYCV